MRTNRPNGFTKIFTTVSFLLMVTMNALANILPINGQNTGQVSNSYANLFAPAGFTFSIWGLIYLLLAGYTLYQFGFFQRTDCRVRKDTFEKVGLYFSISSLANVAWIFAWHYHIISLSMVLMLTILVCLIIIVETISQAELSRRDRVLVRLPFSIYFGWITVATIANATVLLVSLGWNGFGIPDAVWAIVMIVVGLGISVATILKNRDIAYGLVIIWAYTGILIKHSSASGFAGKYPSVINTVIICIALLILVEAFIIFSKKVASKG